jgi:hypothetical protein
VHCIHDKANGLVINHTSDWSGDARIAWYDASEFRDPGPTPSSLRECWCQGDLLVAGRFTLTRGEVPPLDVVTRAVALAVEALLRAKMSRAVEDFFIRRDAL